MALVSMKTDYMLSAADLRRLQQEQFRHDQRNHSDITCLPKSDRLKHYGLHFAKYVGRLARGSSETKPVERTVVDAALICLSAANALHQHLDAQTLSTSSGYQVDSLRTFADAAGRFADACEKIDHLEDFLSIAKEANRDVLVWILAAASRWQIDLNGAIERRRKELKERQFYVAD